MPDEMDHGASSLVKRTSGQSLSARPGALSARFRIRFTGPSIFMNLGDMAGYGVGNGHQPDSDRAAQAGESANPPAIQSASPNCAVAFNFGGDPPAKWCNAGEFITPVGEHRAASGTDGWCCFYTPLRVAAKSLRYEPADGILSAISFRNTLNDRRANENLRHRNSH